MFSCRTFYISIFLIFPSLLTELLVWIFQRKCFLRSRKLGFGDLIIDIQDPMRYFLPIVFAIKSTGGHTSFYKRVREALLQNDKGRYFLLWVVGCLEPERHHYTLSLARELYEYNKDSATIQEIEDSTYCDSCDFPLRGQHEDDKICADASWATSAESDLSSSSKRDITRTDGAFTQQGSKVGIRGLMVLFSGSCISLLPPAYS